MADSTPKGFIDDRVSQQVEALKKRSTTQKHYFEVDPKTKQFVRKFANVVEIDNERAILRIDGEDWAIPSAYDLLDLVDGDWILGFAYPGLNGFKVFYPLGPDNQFLEARDARNAYLPSDVASVSDAEEVKAAQAQQNDLKTQFLRLAEQVAGFHTTAAEFGQALGQIIQNASNVAKAIVPPTPVEGQVAAANATITSNDTKARAPVNIRPRDTAPATDSTTKKKAPRARGRGMKRVQSHFRGEK